MLAICKKRCYDQRAGKQRNSGSRTHRGLTPNVNWTLPQQSHARKQSFRVPLGVAMSAAAC